MKALCVGMLLLGCVLGLAACGKSAEQTESAESAQPAESAESAKEAQASDSGLAGTTWQVGDFSVTFQGPSTIQVTGSKIPIPGGITGTYKVENGAVEISAMGMTRTGSWDGTTLIIDGAEAVKQ